MLAGLAALPCVALLMAGRVCFVTGRARVSAGTLSAPRASAWTLLVLLATPALAAGLTYVAGTALAPALRAALHHDHLGVRRVWSRPGLLHRLPPHVPAGRRRAGR